MFKKVIANLKHWLNWHIRPLPQEISIKSLLETLLYILFVCGCLFLHWKFNEVNIHKETIEIECIDPPCIEDSGIVYIAPWAKIDYYIPMTRTEYATKPEKEYSIDYLDILKDKGGQCVQFYAWNEYAREYNGKTWVYLNIDSVRKAALTKSQFWEKHLFHWIDFYDCSEFEWRHRADSIWFKRHNSSPFHSWEYDTLNSLRARFDQQFPKSLGDSMRYPLYYVGTTTTVTDKFFKGKHKEQNSNAELVWAYTNISYIDKTHIKKEQFVSGNGGCALTPAYGHEKLLKNSYRLPGWFVLEDCSQKYYDIKLRSATIDSITLRFDFVGVTDFSVMKPEPDIITMSKIEFNNPEKIAEIKQNGLRFHADFKELHNMQSIRMFAVTAILGGLITVLLGVVIMAVLNLFVKK